MAEDLEKEIAVAERKAESMLKELEKIEGTKAVAPIVYASTTPQERAEEMNAAELLLHHTVEELGSPGIVVNEALTGSCRCHDIGEGKKLCFSKGIIGTLSQPQREKYCKTEISVPDGMKARIERFRAAATEAHKKIEALPKGERLEPWLVEMGKELRARGIEI